MTISLTKVTWFNTISQHLQYMFNYTYIWKYYSMLKLTWVNHGSALDTFMKMKKYIRVPIYFPMQGIMGRCNTLYKGIMR